MRGSSCAAEVGEAAALGGDAIEAEEVETGRPGEVGDGVGADDRPAEPRPAGPAPLEPGPVGPPAASGPRRGLDLDDHRAVTGQQLATAAQQPFRISTDADVPVG